MADKNSPYIESIKKYHEELKKSLEVLEDPFKAPEIHVMSAQPVLHAIWEMNVQYAVMMQEGHDEKVSEGERT